LWERRFKSVIVEDGLAARTMAAYIDLNPVRAGMVNDPAEYRWSGYGEAVGSGAKGDGKRAREGLVRAWMAHKGWQGDAVYRNGGGRQGNIHADYRAMLLAEGKERIREVSDERTGELRLKLERKGMSREQVDEELRRLEAGRGVAIAKRLRWRLRYLSDGAVIGQRSFVDEVFHGCRDRFRGTKRQDGARRMRGDAAELTKTSGLWSMRDLGPAG